MMLDLLSPGNYAMYNIKLAQVFGLHAAIYIAELLNINDKALRKETIEDNFFTLDRTYITKRTTFNDEEQIAIENRLIRTGVLSRSDQKGNVLCLNINTLIALMSCDDKVVNTNIQRAMKIKQPSKMTARQAQAEQLKDHVRTQNEQLRVAYQNWIDGVYSNPKGFLSKRAIQLFQEAVETFANNNTEIALRVIDIATLHGYREADWAISKYLEEIHMRYRPIGVDLTPATNGKPELDETEVF